MIETTSWRLCSSLFLVAAVLASAPSQASGSSHSEARWLLRFNGITTDPGGDSDSVDALGNPVGIHLESGFGVAASVEYRFSPRMGLQFGALGGVESDVRLGAARSDVSFRNVDALSYTALTAGLDFHLTPGRRVDVYVGPLVARLFYSDVELDLGFDLAFDFNVGGVVVTVDDTVEVPVAIRVRDDFALGAVLGFDVLFGRGHWSLNGNVKYLDTSIEGGFGTDEGQIEFDPLIVGFGFGYRF